MLPGAGTSAHAGEYVPMALRDRPQTHWKSLIIRTFPSVLLLTLGIIVGCNFPSYLSVYSRRPETLSTPSLLPRALPPPPESLIPPSGSLPPPSDPIPNIVHYVWGLAEGDQPDFPYFAYLAMRSAMLVLKPDRIMFHCINEPKGYWWDRVKHWEGWEDRHGIKKGLVDVVPARNVEWVGPSRRPVVHFAHKADIIRLEVLLQHGGIYLDIDTFVIRPFADYSLMLHDTVMGMEAHSLSFFRKPGSDDEMLPKGLCNAIIISRKNSTFLKRWLETYDDFNESRWTEHSVEMPWTLARLYPTSITVMSERTFFWPLWTPDHIHAVYETKEYDFERSGQLAYHAWESMSHTYLAALDPTTIKQIDTSFTRMARRFCEPNEERRWRRHRRAAEEAGSAVGVKAIGQEPERMGWAKRGVDGERGFNLRGTGNDKEKSRGRSWWRGD